eukprot:2232709-Pleurochrysis_carterae.AAC.3
MRVRDFEVFTVTLTIRRWQWLLGKRSPPRGGKVWPVCRREIIRRRLPWGRGVAKHRRPVHARQTVRRRVILRTLPPGRLGLVRASLEVIAVALAIRRRQWLLRKRSSPRGGKVGPVGQREMVRRRQPWRRPLERA